MGGSGSKFSNQSDKGEDHIVDHIMNLLRAILMEVELCSLQDAGQPLVIAGHDDHAVRYHAQLAIEYGLIHVDKIQSGNGIEARILSLTTEGQKFVDVARDEATWDRVIQRTEAIAFWIPFSTFQAMLAKEAIQTLKN